MNVFWKIARLDRPISPKKDTEYYKTQQNSKRYSYFLMISVDQPIEGRYNIVNIADDATDEEKSDSICEQVANSRDNIEVPEDIVGSYPFRSNLSQNPRWNREDLVAIHAIWVIHCKLRINPAISWNLPNEQDSLYHIIRDADYPSRKLWRKLRRNASSWQKKWVLVSTTNNTPQIVKYFATFKKGNKFAEDFLRSNFNVARGAIPNFKNNEHYLSEDALFRVGLYKDGEQE